MSQKWSGNFFAYGSWSFEGGGASFTPPDRSLELNGTDEYFTCGDALDLAIDSAWSLSVWYDYDATANGRIFGAQASKLWMQVLTNNFVLFNYTGDNGGYYRPYTTQHAINNSWTHVVITKAAAVAGASFKIYIDGTERTDSFLVSGTPNTLTVSNPGRVGNDEGSEYFNGHIASPAIWNAELSSADVTRINTLGWQGNLITDTQGANLRAFWPFYSTTDVTSANGIEDASGNGYHGTGVNLASGNLSTNTP